MRATLRRPVSSRFVRTAHPVAELDQLWHELDRWASATRRAPRRARLDHRPRLSHDSEANTWTLRAAVPGVSADSVQITVDKGVLAITTTATKPADEGFTVVARERSTPARTLRWPLPDEADLDGIEASVADGWLQVTVPRTPAPEPRTIAVRAG